MNILFTQHRLLQRGGTEMYLFDLARHLIQSGHRVVVYCPQLGAMHREFTQATIPVVDDLKRVQFQPDVIHGHHGIETLTALLHFPSTPAVYVLHDWEWVFDKPPRMDRIRKYIAVDATCLDRLLIREGIPEEKAVIIQNGVDLVRFSTRAPLPAKPQRALVFSNYLDDQSIDAIRFACQSLGVAVNIAGAQFGSISQAPESLLAQSDLVFAKGRCAREAIATGCAVIVFDRQGMAGLVSSDNVESMSRLNFGRRLLTRSPTEAIILSEMEKYDANDATVASSFVRENFGVDRLTEQLFSIYEQAIAEYADSPTQDQVIESQQVAAYLREWSVEFAQQAQLRQANAGQADSHLKKHRMGDSIRNFLGGWSGSRKSIRLYNSPSDPRRQIKSAG